MYISFFEFYHHHVSAGKWLENVIYLTVYNRGRFKLVYKRFGVL